MGRTIYDKPTRALLKDMLVDLGLKPGEILTTAQAIQWFKDKYPRLKRGTIGAHLVQAATNDKNRLHHSATAADDLLFKLGSKQWRLYEPGKDPAPYYPAVQGGIVSPVPGEDEPEEERGIYEAQPGSSQFALEQDLQRYLADNLSIIEPGLTLFEDEEIKGFEYPAGGGRRIDILGVDKSGAFVVLELKVEKGYERVVGQLLRYMNWVRRELAEPGQRVRGIIVCRAMSEDLQLACASIPNVQLFEYQLSVAVKLVPPLELPQ